MDRRHALHRLAFGSLAVALPVASGAAVGTGSGADDGARFVFVVLRGGMDGLMAVPVPGDPAFAEARGALARFAEPVLPLPGPFALHPRLVQLHAMHGRGELAVLHAVGLPYRERSHFDAQQVLESGGTRPYELSTGWLARALVQRPGLRAVALQTAVPLALRGAAQVDSWAPSTLPEPSADLVARLAGLYRDDAALAAALQRARELRDTGMTSGMSGTGAPGGGGARAAAVALAAKAAEFLQRGSPVAVLEIGGWDSHANQAAPQGATSNLLGALDAALAALRDGLQAGGAWSRTVVLVATEFGREVAINGTQGTDHGSGGAAFVLGGAVAGGRVLADWPGVARHERFEGRDLRTTTDLRAPIKTILAQHLRVPTAAIEREVLPGSAGVRALDGLLRG